jgi:hypothetical protein
LFGTQSFVNNLLVQVRKLVAYLYIKEMESIEENAEEEGFYSSSLKRGIDLLWNNGEI